jgi:flagellar basal body rod protein FlgG
MRRGTGARLLANGQETTEVDDVVLRPASLEASNVAMPEGLARLTSVSRNFEALQRSISTVLNDIDGRFIDQMARR